MRVLRHPRGADFSFDILVPLSLSQALLRSPVSEQPLPGARPLSWRKCPAALSRRGEPRKPQQIEGSELSGPSVSRVRLKSLYIPQGLASAVFRALKWGCTPP